MATWPDGYDGRCGNCGEPYTFKNAKSLGVRDWRCLCSNVCAERAKPLMTGAVMDYTELLPPLPAKEIAFIGGPVRIVYGPYEADEMHAYALAAIAAAAPAIRKAGRERCAQECENLADHYTHDEGAYVADHCALAIRDLKDV